MELSTLDTRKGSDAGFELQLLHPGTRAPLDAWITVLGKDGSAYQEKQNEIRRRRLESLARLGTAGAGAVERVDAEALELLAATTKGWRGIEENGQPIAFSEGAALQLYTRFEWIREQVDAAIHFRANFLPGGATS